MEIVRGNWMLNEKRIYLPILLAIFRFLSGCKGAVGQFPVITGPAGMGDIMGVQWMVQAFASQFSCTPPDTTVNFPMQEFVMDYRQNGENQIGASKRTQGRPPNVLPQDNQRWRYVWKGVNEDVCITTLQSVSSNLLLRSPRFVGETLTQIEFTTDKRTAEFIFELAPEIAGCQMMYPHYNIISIIINDDGSVGAAEPLCVTPMESTPQPSELYWDHCNGSVAQQFFLFGIQGLV